MVGSGRNGPRSKSGCTSCLIRKVKCDERKPICQRCGNAKLQCSWDRAARKEHQVQRSRKGVSSRRKNILSSDLGDVRPIPIIPSASWSSSPSPLTVPTSAKGSVDESSGTIALSSATTSPSPSTDFSYFYPFFFDVLGDTERALVPWSSATPSPLSQTFSIPKALSTNHIPFSNSILPSSQDRIFIDYFPSSRTVYETGKNYNWSNFRHLCQNKAADDSLVMQSMLALSASELHRNGRGSSLIKSNDDQDPGLYYYGLALQKLFVALGELNNSKGSLESVISALYLLVTYESKFGTSTSDLQLHIEGVRSYIETNLQEVGKDSSWMKSEFTPFCAQLLLWMAYVDASAIHGLTSFPLYSSLLSSSNPALTPDRLFTYARSSYRKIYGANYPLEEVQDDLENYRPLEMIHQDYTFRHRIWKLANAIQNDELSADTPNAIWEDLLAVGEKYGDLMSDSATLSYGQRRVIRTIWVGSAGYQANILLHRRLLTPSTPPTDIHRAAVSAILKIAHEASCNDDRNMLFGWAWILFLAGIETDDPIHRDWIKCRLDERRLAGKDFEAARRMIDEVETVGREGWGGVEAMKRLLGVSSGSGVMEEL